MFRKVGFCIGMMSVVTIFGCNVDATVVELKKQIFSPCWESLLVASGVDLMPRFASPITAHSKTIIITTPPFSPSFFTNRIPQLLSSLKTTSEIWTSFPHIIHKTFFNKFSRKIAAWITICFELQCWLVLPQNSVLRNIFVWWEKKTRAALLIYTDSGTEIFWFMEINNLGLS